MDASTMKTLAQRVERLERENRRLRRGGLLALVVLAALGALGQAPPAGTQKVLEAEGFAVRDTAGKVRAVLGMLADNAPALVLYNEAGKIVTSLAREGEGTRLVFFDQAQRQRVSLGTATDGTGHVALIDTSGKGRALLAMAPSGRAGVNLVDQAGRTRVSVGTLEDGSPVLQVYDPAGKVLWKTP